MFLFAILRFSITLAYVWTLDFCFAWGLWVVYSLFGLNCRYQSFGRQEVKNKTKPEMKCSRRDMQEYLPSYSFGGRWSEVGTWSIYHSIWNQKLVKYFSSKIIMKTTRPTQCHCAKRAKKTNHPLPHLDPPQMKAHESFYVVLCWVEPHNGAIPKIRPRIM
jgi:hypothetical protein